MTHYLDNAATTKPCEACVNAVDKMIKSCWGNPSSLHRLGIDAMKEVILARKTVADTLGAASEEIIFTSGGTEANNLALFGAVKARRRSGNKIVTTMIEHESVLQSAQELEREGFEVVYLKPDKYGFITEEQIFNAVDKNTILVSVMYVNNEIGSVMPIDKIKKAVKHAGSNALIHADCVQAYGKIPLNVKKLGVDLATVSAHKIHGVKGAGALYINKSSNLTQQNFARVFGGEQERRIRPGTESAPLIAGFGAAAAQIDVSSTAQEKIASLNAYAREKLGGIDGVKFNSGKNASPYIINIYAPTFMRSQTIVQELSAKYGVYVSNGSACAKGKKSHVLTAIGLDHETIDKSIRISLSQNSTAQDIDALAEALADLTKNYPRG